MITENEAILIAKDVAKRNSWAWVEPANAVLRRPWFKKGGRWEIFSNALHKGAKVRVVVDAQTGHILEKGYIPR